MSLKLKVNIKNNINPTLKSMQKVFFCHILEYIIITHIIIQ